MKKRWVFISVLVCVILLALAVGLSWAEGARWVSAAPQAQMGTSFTYQGRLTDGAVPANGEYDFRFSLYDVAEDGTPISIVTVVNKQVTDGLFTVQLDFGPEVFTGGARYLEIGVRPGASSGADPYTTLTPRQELTPAPYALALPGLWTQQNATSPNLIGGYEGNIVTGTVGATIGGGGQSGYPNQVTADYATVGGGDSNRAGGSYATIGGGWSNTAIDFGTTVGGGGGNDASVDYATVGGGCNNDAIGYGATISGGYHNDASSDYATVPGGRSNEADGNYSFAAGRRAKADHAGAFVWADSTNSDFASVTADTFVVRASGGVGLGTNNPQNQLHVQESVNWTDTAIPTGHVVQVENTSTGDNADGLAIKVGRTDNPNYANNFITFFRGDDTAVGAIDGDGSGGVTYSSGGSDYAEFLPRLHPEEVIEPGDVLGVFAGRVSKATEDAERIMVVSTRPIVLGNDPGAEEQGLYERVAFIGQVDVRVRGPVAAGDFIVPSGLGDGSGIAVAPEAITPEQFTQLVGRAWESSDATGLKQVRVAVGLPQYMPDVAARIQELEEENAALRSQNTDFEARLAALERGGESRVSQLPSPWWLVGGLSVVGLATQRRRFLGGGQ